MITYEGQDYVTTTEAMKILGIKARQTIYDLIANEKLTPYTMTGNKNYFLKSQVDSLHAERNTPKLKKSKAAKLNLGFAAV